MKIRNGWMGRFGLFFVGALIVSFQTAGCETDESFPPPVWQQTTTGGESTTSEEPPNVEKEAVLPPVSGGTLLITKGGLRAVAADPDVDVIWTARLDTGVQEHVIELEKKDEPGRLVESADGMVHVALRGAGEVATIDPMVGELIRRTPVCQMPRGLDYDAASDQVVVGCAEGKIVVFDAQSGAIAKSLTVDSDVRDVFFLGDRFVITRLRSAEFITLSGNGQEIDRAKPPELPGDAVQNQHSFSPMVAWRTVRMPDGSFLMVHQRARSDAIAIDTEGAYTAIGCGDGIMHGTLTQFFVAANAEIEAPVLSAFWFKETLPLDVVLPSDAEWFAVALAGTQHVLHRPVATLHDGETECDSLGPAVDGTPVGLGESNGNIVVLVRGPGAIEIPQNHLRIELNRTASNAGHALFHGAPDKTVACASCHPEGHEDGHIWNFESLGPRRSKSLRGGVQATLPLNWDGGMADIHALVSEVFVKRMGGSPPTEEEEKSLVEWIESLPRLPPIRDPQDEAALRGKKLFESAEAGCSTCHSGEHFTNNQNEDVGLGSALQVPSLLGVAWRLPLMHNGCAATLLEWFNPECGGPNHGQTAQLSEDDKADLTAYLESL